MAPVEVLALIIAVVGQTGYESTFAQDFPSMAVIWVRSNFFRENRPVEQGESPEILSVSVLQCLWLLWNVSHQKKKNSYKTDTCPESPLERRDGES